MATIQGDTDRRLHLLPGVDVGQALQLGMTGLLVWTIWSAPLPSVARSGLAGFAGTAGAVLALGRWPLGPRGERLTGWLGRVLRYAVRPRWLRGGRVARRGGVDGLTPGGLRRGGRTFRVLACAGRDHAARGAGALEAAQSAFVEFLHGADGPVQVVSLSAWLTEADRPRSWDPDAAPSELRSLASAYRDHWGEAVRGRLLCRTCVTVLAPPPGPLARPAAERALAETEAAFRAAAERMGLAPEPAGPDRLAPMLRRLLGAGSGTNPPPTAGFWRVERDPARLPPRAGLPRAGAGAHDPDVGQLEAEGAHGEGPRRSTASRAKEGRP